MKEMKERVAYSEIMLRSLNLYAKNFFGSVRRNI